MFSLAVALFVFQLFAISSTLLLSHCVMGASSLDFQLMFLQGPLDKLLNMKRYRNSIYEKMVMLFLSLVSVGIFFFPTLFILKEQCARSISSMPPDPDTQTYKPTPSPFLSLPMNDISATPFDTSYGSLTYGTPNLHGVLEDYLANVLKLPVKNIDYSWYEPSSSYYLGEMMTQRLDSNGTYFSDDNTPTYTFELHQQDSFTLSSCKGQPVSNFSEIEGHRVMAIAKDTNSDLSCYPLYDPAVSVSVNVNSLVRSTSVLGESKNPFRSLTLYPDSGEILSTIAVSAMNLNDSAIAIAVKKTVHLTILRSEWQTAVDCSTKDLDSSYQDEKPWNSITPDSKILCHLKDLLQQNTSLNTAQATRHFADSNVSISSIYTYGVGSLGGYTIDLTFLRAFTVKNPLFMFPKQQEYLVMDISRSSFGFSEETVKEMLSENRLFANILDPSSKDLPILVDVRASLLQGSTHYIEKYTTELVLVLSYDTNKWIIAIAVVLILLILVLAFCGKKNNSLRTLISQCPIEAAADDTATLVDGKKHANTRRVKLSLVQPPRGAASQLPVLAVDGNIIHLN